MTAQSARNYVDGSKPDTALGVNVANFELGTGNLWDCIQTLGVGVFAITFGTATLTQANAGINLIDASGGNVIINLPAASAAVGALMQFKRVDNSANSVTINRAGSDTMDGLTSYVMSGQFEFLEMKSDGVSVWRFLSTQANTPRARALLGVVATQVRQTVSAGGVDANGFANFLSIGTGLVVNVAATAVPIVTAFAAGFGANGAVDYVDTVSADTTAAFTALTASSILFLGRDRNTSTGAMTYLFTSLAPVYQFAAPSSPASGQYWFDRSTFLMKRWSGSAWVVTQTVFWGECVTGLATVTSVITYALLGTNRSVAVACAGLGVTTTFAHNIGVLNCKLQHYLVCFSATGGWAIGDTMTNVMTVAGANYMTLEPRQSGRNNSTVTTSLTQAYAAIDPASASNTAVGSAAFNQYMVADRGW